MLQGVNRHKLWVTGWLVVALAGSYALAQHELGRLRDLFETDARIAHRLLSQRVVQHDAVLATLALLQPEPGASPPELRLPSVYPQILGVQRRDPGASWPDPALQVAEGQSLAWHRPALAGLDLANGRYQLVLAATPASFALRMDLRAVVPWSEWPTLPDSSPVRVTLDYQGQSFVVQPGQLRDGGWRFDFRKHLAADSQPFDVVATRQVGWGELPWAWMLGWTLITALALAATRALLHQRERRLRAEELLRLGQVTRLNTLGELAAGMAHEISQPLTAVLANTQAAIRLLAEEPPETGPAHAAMAQAATQARRASDVVGRLRRTVQRPDPSAPGRAVVLQEVVRNALHLLEPQLLECKVETRVEAGTAPVTVMAEPIALEQIIHNLLMNALQALEQVPVVERRLVLSITDDGAQGVLTVADTGPGVASEALPRLFEPFFSTRTGGLGLGLSLCETLTGRMGGQLGATHNTPRGAVFRLALPRATP